MPSFGGGQMNPQQLMLLQLLLGGGGMGGVNPASGQANGMMGLLGMGQPQGPNQVPGAISPQQALMQQILNPPPSQMQQILAGIRQMQQGGGQPPQAMPGNPLLGGGGGMTPQQMQMLMMARQTANTPGQGGMPQVPIRTGGPGQLLPPGYSQPGMQTERGPAGYV